LSQQNSLNHIAIILDGNKRWSIKEKTSILKGYEKGLEKINLISNFAIDNKINYLTLYTLSSENIKRNTVNHIYKIIYEYFNNFLNKIIDEKKIKLKIIGERNNIPKEILNIINECEIKTSNNNTLNLNLAFNYGFKNELIYVLNQVKKNKSNIHLDINNIKKLFYLGEIPDPDLLIRTGGYQRLSNFILFNLTYSELFFTDTLWPDFTTKELKKIIFEYKKIERNYGL
tara:strand:+ start:3027 stop:3713 length:687 start_codon:yes stop_codon:yes gene_type:complete